MFRRSTTSFTVKGITCVKKPVTRSNALAASFSWLQMRFQGSNTQQFTTKPQQPLDQIHSIPNSPVDVESFTLDEDIVEVHMAASRKWREWSDSLDAAKSKSLADGRREAVIEVLCAGRKLLEEIGEENSPILCDVMLRMEEGQAFSNNGDYDTAIKSSTEALALLNNKGGKPDPVQVAEIKELTANIYLAKGDYSKARAVYDDLMQWIEVEAPAKEQPMVQVSAKNMKRNIMSGIGLCMEAEAAATKDRTLWNSALDKLVDALNLHIEEKDVGMVKQCLNGCLRCFEALNDKKQAIGTAKKYIAWCREHDDTEGVAFGEKRFDQLVEKFGPI